MKENNPTHNSSNQTLPKNTSLPYSSKKRIGNIRSSPNVPKKIKYASTIFAVVLTKMTSTILRFHTATLIMIALQITNATRTKYRRIFKRFNMIGS
jgi:hypothetical protein